MFDLAAATIATDAAIDPVGNMMEDTLPPKTYTISQADEIVRTHLQMLFLLYYASSGRLHRSFLDVVFKASVKKRKQRLNFSGTYLSHLRSALAQFTMSSTSSFGIPHGAQLNNSPIPTNLQHLLVLHKSVQ